ncbi:MAG: flagellar export chaperone FlgN [Lachnospiraceae bacterium]|nr:flagellar export chaperone FlgN [Lachnospiraceae bacterium]
MEQNYVNIMMETLQKKVGVLDAIIRKNEEQSRILESDITDWDAFDKNADEKSDLIDKIEEIDQGFDSLFQKVKDVLQSPAGKQTYKVQIGKMQQLITQITEKSVEIQAAEVRNKALIEKRFAQSHQRIGQSRTSSRVARDYYKNMQQAQVVAPAFLDKKN